eukprot:COSAG06_NODE_1290_length_9985_cov_3.727190_5_plen_368_part_00
MPPKTRAADAKEASEPLAPMPVPKEMPNKSTGAFTPAAVAAVISLQAAAGLGLLAWLQPNLLEPETFSKNKAVAALQQLVDTLGNGGAVTKEVGAASVGALLAGATALVLMAFMMGRGSVDPTSYSKPKRGKVTSSIVSQLRKIVGDESVHSSGTEMSKHGRDQSFHERHPPDVVVYCHSVEQVRDVVKVCYDNHVPCVPRGAGTGLEGGCIPYEGGVALDLAKMKKMELRKDDMQAVLGPGCIKNDINEWLEPSGYLFGPDPASNPSVGGMASTRGSGLSTMMYGTTAENVLSMLVVTAEGKLIRTRQCTRKSSTGYELNQLYIGSEGTLGVICELVVKIYPIMPVSSSSVLFRVRLKAGLLVSFR